MLEAGAITATDAAISTAPAGSPTDERKTPAVAGSAATGFLVVWSGFETCSTPCQCVAGLRRAASLSPASSMIARGSRIPREFPNLTIGVTCLRCFGSSPTRMALRAQKQFLEPLRERVSRGRALPEVLPRDRVTIGASRLFDVRKVGVKSRLHLILRTKGPGHL